MSGSQLIDPSIQLDGEYHDYQRAADHDSHDGSILAICTDASRSGCSIYNGTSVQLVADRKDLSDPFRGLDILIQRTNPKIVIVSMVQKRLVTFLEGRFRMKIIDVAQREISKGRKCNNSIGSNPSSSIAQTQPTQSSSAGHLINESLGTQQRKNISNQMNHNLIINNPPVSLFSDNISTQGHESINQDELLVPVDIDQIDFTLAIVPNFWFSITNGFEKLIESELVANQAFVTQEDKIMFVATKVEKSVDVCAVRSIGAIYAYITKYLYSSFDSKFVKVTPMNETQTSSHVQQLCSTWQSRSSDEPDLRSTLRSLMPIYEFKYVDPGPVLSIDRFTLESLSIFKITRPGRASLSHVNTDPDLEEIPTLYDLLNQCQSLQGKRQLHTIMLWPLQDSIAIRNRLDAVEFFMQTENLILREELSVQIKSVVPLQKILGNMSHSLVNYKELASVYRALAAFVAIIDIIKEKGTTLSNYLLTKIVNLDSQVMRNMIESIVKMIDFDESKRDGNLSVCFGVDENVDTKKELFNNMTKICQDSSIRETTFYKHKFGKICKVIYVPRIGFLNSVEFSSLSDLLEFRRDPDFDVLLHTERSVYFKTPYMEELDKTMGDIVCDLIDVQEDILVQLQRELLKLSDPLLSLMELIGELDCIMAFAIVSSARGYTRPDVLETNEIDIRLGYHPLHSVKCNTIPNDIKFYKEMSGKQVKVMLITGPNSCGKTTYMKATCLIAYMAHIGCFVPASYAQIPVLDAILTRMNSANSISTGLSSFATDLHQVNYALGRATEKSLIAIDEFGTGTRARDGLHLLKGLIIYLTRKGSISPHVMISSHFTQLSFLLEQHMDDIIFKTFKVTKNLERNCIQYDFQVMDGISENTLADEVASRSGVPAAIISRAKQIREYILQGRPISQREFAPMGA